jgi:tetratricopeptide (TPR) repeat protein
MKQSLPWSKKSGGVHVSKGSGNYSDAVAMALKSDSGNVIAGEKGVEVVNPMLVKNEGREKRRLRTRSPSPAKYLEKKPSINVNRRGITDSGHSSNNGTIASKYSRDELESNHSSSLSQQHLTKNDDAESNAPSSTAPSFFNNRNIRSMSPAKLKTSLKQKFLEKVPSSPRRDYNLSPSGGTEAEDAAANDEMVAKFAGASISFDLEDDYEVAQINKDADDAIPENSPPGNGEFIINTTCYNIFENAQFLQAMGGSNDASLATNYIRTGDALCSSEESQFDRALPLYYAGLGAILTRIRKWSLRRRNTSDDNVDGEEHKLVYQDFSALAQSPENVLLLAMASILLRAGNANFSLGRFETACRDYASAQSYRSLRQKALGRSEDVFVPVLASKSQEERNLLLEDAKLDGRISNNLACAQTKRKMYDEARAEYTKALQIKQKTLDKVHELSSALENGSAPQSQSIKDDDLVSDIASTFHNIGLLRVNCDEPNKAEKAFKQSLSLRVKKFGVNHLSVSSSLCALGDVYYHQKRYDDAFRSYKESLRVWKFHRGNDIRTAELYYNIGLVFYFKGPYLKAKLAVTECLRIRNELCGNNSLLVAAARHLLGLIYTAIGEYEEALVQLQEAQGIRQRLLGKNSPNHLLIHNEHLAIGKVLSLMGEFDKAMKSFSTVLMGRTIKLGKHHPLVAEVLQTIGDAYIGVSEYSKAAETLEEALRLRKSLLGQSMEVAETLNSLSLVYFCCDDTEQAIDLCQQSVKELKSTIGSDHFLVAKALKNSGDYKQSMDLLDDAISDYSECLRVMTSWQGRDHISLSEVLNEIGVTYFKKEEFVLAKESFTEVRISSGCNLPSSFVLTTHSTCL